MNSIAFCVFLIIFMIQIPENVLNVKTLVF